MKDKSEIAAIAVIVLGVALIAGLVVNENRKGETDVLGTRFASPTPTAVATGDPFVIPTIDSTIVPTPTPTPTVAPATPTPTATATTTARPATTATTIARPATVAAYLVEVRCGETVMYSDGTGVGGSGGSWRETAAAGKRTSYEFNYQREQSGRQVTSQRKTCEIKTERTRAGSEPSLRVTLACDGRGTYETSPPPSPSTNVISRTWRLSELQSGFTHEMRNKPGQVSEQTTCEVRVV
ncbi:MAG TPA: hypothetical protein VM841_07120 [Actinomycetota bacterium]|nr:hypothetical protein [Actinomycetota bacterium]